MRMIVPDRAAEEKKDYDDDHSFIILIVVVVIFIIAIELDGGIDYWLGQLRCAALLLSSP